MPCNTKIKSLTLPRILVTEGGSATEAYPLPSTRLGFSSLSASLPRQLTTPKENAKQAVGFVSPFFFCKNL
jgi:hypothetical protein